MQKTEMLTVFYFFFMVTRGFAHHVEKIRKDNRRFISLEGAFRENGAKIAKNFNMKIIIAENWNVWPIFIF